MHIKQISVIVLALGITSFAFAAPQESLNPLSAFQKVVQVPELSIKVPTVVEVPFTELFANRLDFAVLDTTTKTFEPYLFKETLKSARTLVEARTPQGLGVRMIDGDTDTYEEFTLPEVGQGTATISLHAEKPIALSTMTVLLDRYVALPTSVEIRATVDGTSKVVLARMQPSSHRLSFPKTTAQDWVVSFTYSQLLRIGELILNEESAGIQNMQALRFLAQPGHQYRVYADADRSINISVGESGNLVIDKGVLVLPKTQAISNADYVLADTDNDAIPDINDNCVSVPNADQVDIDQNGRGDVCDDFDRDGVMNSGDNCTDIPNRNQSDIDADGKGDVCDGEESRVTEKYPWLPWAGMGFAGLVLVVLFVLTVRSMRKGA